MTQPRFKRSVRLSSDVPHESSVTTLRIEVLRGKRLSPRESDLLAELVIDYLGGIGFDSITGEPSCFQRSNRALQRDLGRMGAYILKKKDGEYEAMTGLPLGH